MLIAMFDLRLHFPFDRLSYLISYPISYLLKCDVLVCNHKELVLAATNSLFSKEQENAKDIYCSIRYET